MARKSSRHSGFSPDNLKKGLLETIDSLTEFEKEKTVSVDQKNTPDEDDSKAINQAEKEKAKESAPTKSTKKKPGNQKKAQEKNTSEKEQNNTQNKNEDNQLTDETHKEIQIENDWSEVNEGPNLSELLDGSRNKKNQNNVYLSSETELKLNALADLIGKANGGKSFIVEAALREYFNKNAEILEKALSKQKNNPKSSPTKK